MPRRKIAVIGVGKIAVDAHLPAIRAEANLELAALVSPHGGHGELGGKVPVFRTASELHSAMPEVRLVSICTPPAARTQLAREALAAGCDVLMEKPPTPTLSEFHDLVDRACAAERVLFQTWHSRYNDAVERAGEILRRDGLASLRIDWCENVRTWHPGQDWVWEPGGFGVFDPGINALSILTRIAPFPVFVGSAKLSFPSNRQAPAAADIEFASARPDQPRMIARFDWCEEQDEIWTIAIRTGRSDELSLERGGALLRVNGKVVVDRAEPEYARVYRRFVDLVDSRRCDVDDAPLKLTADAFLVGERVEADPFEWEDRAAAEPGQTRPGMSGEHHR